MASDAGQRFIQGSVVQLVPELLPRPLDAQAERGVEEASGEARVGDEFQGLLNKTIVVFIEGLVDLRAPNSADLLDARSEVVIAEGWVDGETKNGRLLEQGGWGPLLEAASVMKGFEDCEVRPSHGKQGRWDRELRLARWRGPSCRKLSVRSQGVQRWAVTRLGLRRAIITSRLVSCRRSRSPRVVEETRHTDRALGQYRGREREREREGRAKSSPQKDHALRKVKPQQLSKEKQGNVEDRFRF